MRDDRVVWLDIDCDQLAHQIRAIEFFQEDYESAEYKVVESDGKLEVREYQS
ncbi:MAG: hypothetical protein RLY14_1056 [Planctomycetota bacterium]|jgi:hypothetical protein